MVQTKYVFNKRTLNPYVETAIKCIVKNSELDHECLGKK